jgi:hypothetical protein
MRIFQSNKLSYLLLLTVVLTYSYSCTDIEGKTFYIAGEAKKYMIESTETSIIMEDNVGLKETFHIEKGGLHNSQSPTFIFFEEFKGSGGFSGIAFAEIFGVTYKSVMSQYYFKYSLTSEIDTKLVINWCLDSYNFSSSSWEDNNRFEYNFNTKKVSSKLKPKVKFLDSMVVNNITYQDVIEIDYSSLKDKINENTPIKIYFAGKAGLIKFVPLEGIEVERIK